MYMNMHMYVHTEISENKGVLAAERKNQDMNQVKKLACRKTIPSDDLVRLLYDAEKCSVL